MTVLRRVAALALLLLACSASPAAAITTTPDPGPSVNGHVNAIVRSGNLVYFGGLFDSVNGVPRQNLAAIDAVTGALSDWNPGASDEVLTMDAGETDFYVGGRFTLVAGAPRSALAAFNLASGALTGWNPSANDTVHSLSVTQKVFNPFQKKLVYVGGSFTGVGGQTRPGLAAIEPDTGQATEWNPRVLSGAVFAVLWTEEVIYAGGDFTGLATGPARLAAISLADDGQAVNWQPKPDGPVYAIEATSSTVWVGGSFTKIGRQIDPGTMEQLPRQNIASLDGGLPPGTGNVKPWDPGANGTVRALARSSTAIYAGGEFTVIGGAGRNGLAELDPGSGAATGWDPAPGPGGLRTILFQSSALFVGGGFSDIGGSGRSGYASFSEAPASTAAPAITGDPVTGGTLTCAAGEWSGTQPQAYAYEWLRDGAPLGASGATYVVTAADVGHDLTCRVTATNLAGSATATSAPLKIPAPPAPPAPPDTKAPTVAADVLAARLRKALRTGLKVRVRCNERCRATVTLQIDAKTAKRYELGRKLTTIGRASKALAARRRTSILVRFTKKAVKALGSARLLRLRVTIVAKDRSGNTTRKVRKVTLR